MNTKLIKSILIAGLLSLTLNYIASAEEVDDTAEIVFIRSSVAGAMVKLHICQIVDGEPVPIGTLKRRGKVTHSLPSGDYQFVAYSTGTGLGPSLECYIEATVVSGRSYYVLADFSVGILPGPYVSADVSYTLVPFKKEPVGDSFHLESPRLHRMLRETPESSDTPELSEHFAERIQKQLPRLKKQYDKLRKKRGDILVLLPEDSYSQDLSLEENLLSTVTEDVADAKESDLRNRVAQFAPPSGLSPDSIREAIILAGQHREYELVGQANNRLVFNLQNRGYNATYTVRYDIEKIEIFSNTFRIKNSDIPVENESWAANLQHSLTVYLERALVKATDFAEVTDHDPEGYATKDLGNVIDRFPIPAGLQPGDVQEMIVRASMDRHYTPIARLEGLVAVNLVHRKYDVTYIFKYDNRTVTMYSDIFKTKKPDTQIEIEGWAENLKATINVYLARKQR